MGESTDIELLRDYLRLNSDDAFAELVRRHVNLVYSAALRQVGNPAQAQEIGQAVFIVLARKAASLRADAILGAWLYETTRLTALHFLRVERRRQWREQQAFMRANLQNEPDPIWEQLAPLLDEGIARLGSKDRQAVILRFFEDKSVREVAATLKINEPAAQKRICRAIGKLRMFFVRRGVVVAAGALTAAIASRAAQPAPAGFARAAASAAIAPNIIPPSTLTLAKGALKIMAWSKAQTAIVTASMMALATYSVVQHHNAFSLMQETEALRHQLAAAQSEKEAMAMQYRLRIAHVSAQSKHDAAPTTLYTRLKDKRPKLTSEQVDAYLKANGRSAHTLLAAFRTSGDESLLKQAMAEFPNDPHVAFEAATDLKLSPEERTQWLNAFEKAAPDNSLANYLCAINDFKAGQTDQAVQELTAAADKPFDDYTVDRAQGDVEALMASGFSPADAKTIGTSELVLPQLVQMKDLAQDMVQMADTYSQAGDSASAQAVLQTAVEMGDHYGTSTVSEPEISQLVGIRIEQMALQAMDPSAPYGDSGQTVQDQLNQLTQQFTSIKQLGQQAEQYFPQVTDDDWIVYKDRWLMFGEANAQQWLIGKYGPH